MTLSQSANAVNLLFIVLLFYFIVSIISYFSIPSFIFLTAALFSLKWIFYIKVFIVSPFIKVDNAITETVKNITISLNLVEKLLSTAIINAKHKDTAPLIPP